MNQRQLDPTQQVIPDQPVLHSSPAQLSEVPEERIFDKAEEATNLEQLQADLETTKAELKDLRSQLKSAAEAEQTDLQQRITKAEALEAWIKTTIAQRLDQ